MRDSTSKASKLTTTPIRLTNKICEQWFDRARYQCSTGCRRRRRSEFRDFYFYATKVKTRDKSVRRGASQTVIHRDIQPLGRVFTPIDTTLPAQNPTASLTVADQRVLLNSRRPITSSRWRPNRKCFGSPTTWDDLVSLKSHHQRSVVARRDDVKLGAGVRDPTNSKRPMYRFFFSWDQQTSAGRFERK